MSKETRQALANPLPPRGDGYLGRTVAAMPLGIGNRIAPLLSGDGLKAKALRGSAWTLGGYGAQQVIRLGSNLILTRLLFPEAFGLMALVGVFMQGLQMFSDVGIGPSIIQNERGDDPDFLNTAWTIQVARGFVLWLGACVLAVPVARLYDEPMLVQLLPVAGLSAVIAGFNSTKIFSCNRHLALGRLTALELGSQAIAITCLVVLAWWMQSVWALVIGGLIGGAVKTILAQTTLPGPINRFCWDPSATKSLFSFGKWIFITTTMSFVTRQGDKLILGGFLSQSELGVYVIAVFLTEAGTQAVSTIAQRVAFPSLSRIAREQPERISEVMYRVRKPIEWIVLPAAGFLMLGGPLVIDVLYDERYAAAGWMLQVFAARLTVGPLANVGMQTLIAMGYPRYATLIQSARAVLMLVGVPLAFTWFGLAGGIWMITLNFCIGYPIVSGILIRHGLFAWRSESRVAFPLATGLLVGIAVMVITK